MLVRQLASYIIVQQPPHFRRPFTKRKISQRSKFTACLKLRWPTALEPTVHTSSSQGLLEEGDLGLQLGRRLLLIPHVLHQQLHLLPLHRLTEQERGEIPSITHSTTNGHKPITRQD